MHPKNINKAKTKNFLSTFISLIKRLKSESVYEVKKQCKQTLILMIQMKL